MRHLFRLALLTTAVALWGCDAFTSPDAEVLLRFGAVADVQYCDSPQLLNYLGAFSLPLLPMLHGVLLRPASQEKH